MDRFKPVARPQIVEYFARMNVESRTVRKATLAREAKWRESILALKARWPLDKINTFTKLAALAEVTKETVSRLETRCPKSNDPTPELARICAVLGVTPESLWASHLDIVEPVALDPVEAAKRVAPLRRASKIPSKTTTSDADIIVGYSSLSPKDKAIVRDLIARLSQQPTVERQT